MRFSKLSMLADSHFCVPIKRLEGNKRRKWRLSACQLESNKPSLYSWIIPAVSGIIIIASLYRLFLAKFWWRTGLVCGGWKSQKSGGISSWHGFLSWCERAIKPLWKLQLQFRFRLFTTLGAFFQRQSRRKTVNATLWSSCHGVFFCAVSTEITELSPQTLSLFLSGWTWQNRWCHKFGLLSDRSFFFFLLEKWNKKSQPNKQYGEIFLSTARWKSSRWSWLKLKKSRVRSVSNFTLHIIQLMLWRAWTKGLMYAIWAQNRENKTEMFAARTFDHKSQEKLDACIN